MRDLFDEWRDAPERAVHWDIKNRGAEGTDAMALLRASEVFREVDDPSTLDVLDYAAGPGRLAVPLAARFNHVTLADINPRFLESARSRFESVGRKNFDTILLDNPIPTRDTFGRSFDIIVSDLFISHLPIKLVPPFFDLFYELIKPGGLFMFGQPIYEKDREPRYWQDISTWSIETFYELTHRFEVVNVYPNETKFDGTRGANHFRLHTIQRN